VIDMNVSPRVAQWLREEGLDAVHLQEQDLGALGDDQIFAKALAEGRTIVTFDQGFADILARAVTSSAGIILLRTKSAHPDRVIERLRTVLREGAGAPARGPSSSSSRRACASGKSRQQADSKAQRMNFERSEPATRPPTCSRT
jgi:predicted nuclease of predicted toxin-antitoxin system